jgi:hypothetical protein
MNRWKVGKDRGSKETDGCPLTAGLKKQVNSLNMEKIMMDTGLVSFREAGKQAFARTPL